MQSREGSFSPSPRMLVTRQRCFFLTKPGSQRYWPVGSIVVCTASYPHTPSVTRTLLSDLLTADSLEVTEQINPPVYSVKSDDRYCYLENKQNVLLCLEIKCVPEARFRVLIWICFPCRYCSVRWLPWRHIWDYVHCFNSFESNCIVFTWL